MDDELDPREAARTRRRDRDADAERQELMRPGMGKVFKQITDSWSKDATSDHDQAGKSARKRGSRPG